MKLRFYKRINQERWKMIHYSNKFLKMLVIRLCLFGIMTNYSNKLHSFYEIVWIEFRSIAIFANIKNAESRNIDNKTAFYRLNFMSFWQFNLKLFPFLYFYFLMASDRKSIEMINCLLVGKL